MPVEVEVGIGLGGDSDSVYAGGRAKRFIESRDGQKFMTHFRPWSL